MTTTTADSTTPNCHPHHFSPNSLLKNVAWTPRPSENQLETDGRGVHPTVFQQAAKQEHGKLVLALQDQLTAAQEASLTLKHQLDAMRAKLAEAKRNLSTLSARKKAADFKKKMHSSPCALESGGAVDNAFAKFERLREKVEQAEAEADALAELQGATCESDADFASLSTSADAEIDAQLQALKQRKQP